MKWKEEDVSWRFCRVCHRQYMYISSVDAAWKKRFCGEDCKNLATLEKEIADAKKWQVEHVRLLS